MSTLFFGEALPEKKQEMRRQEGLRPKIAQSSA